MKEHPILFTGAMVCAIREGRKTQTRRVIKPQPEWKPEGGYDWYQRDRRELWQQYTAEEFLKRSPYGVPGDLLWVREAWTEWQFSTRGGRLLPKRVVYKADAELHGTGLWRPSIHMPRWASRITLEVTEVRVERVQEIEAEDCEAEGIATPEYDMCDGAWRDAFAETWDSINAKRGFGWKENPYVWVVGFKVAEVKR